MLSLDNACSDCASEEVILCEVGFSDDSAVLVKYVVCALDSEFAKVMGVVTPLVEYPDWVLKSPVINVS